MPEGGETMAVTATPLSSRLQLQVMIGSTSDLSLLTFGASGERTNVGFRGGPYH